jgi:hypothetical protein
MSCANLGAINTDRNPSEVVAAELKPLWLHGQFVSDRPTHNFYATGDRDVLVLAYAGLWVGSPYQSVKRLHCGVGRWSQLEGT